MRFFLLSAFILTLAAPAYAQMETLARQAIVVDYDTGAILLEKNADEKMPTSSMSKVLTAYLVFDALDKGTITMEDKFLVSERAWNIQGSKMFVELNATIPVKDLIKGVIIQSGNDATIVLAEGLAGTEEGFADKMNAKAKELGMENSHFMNASGWPDPEHYSTARDLAILGRALISNHANYYPVYSELDFTWHGIKQGNRNPLLYKGAGGDGIKTGHTKEAGYGLMGSGISGGRRVVFVVNGLASMEERTQEATKLLQWGLNSFRSAELFKAGQAVETANVVMGDSKTVTLVAPKDLKFTVPYGAASQFKISVRYKSPLVAPIQKGQEVGMLVVEAPNMKPIELPLQAGESVEKLGFFAMLPAKAKLLVSGG
ncbi:MAG: D-alanyl-D-alanine carboxypeptidase family protein [Alphaproteobacteria bacterium]